MTPRLASLEKRPPTSMNNSTEWRKYIVDGVTLRVYVLGLWATDCPQTSTLGERVVNGGKSSTEMMLWQGQSRGWTRLIHLGLEWYH